MSSVSAVVVRDKSVKPVVIGRGSRGAKGNPGSGGEGYASRGDLAAVAATDQDDGYLTEPGRTGKFVFSSAEVLHSSASLAALIALDTDQGVAVPDGSGGAWQRPDAWLDIEHFGLVGYNSVDTAKVGIDNLARINRAISVAKLLGRPLYLRRFYPVSDQIDTQGVQIIGPGYDLCGFVMLTSSVSTNHLMYAGDVTGLRLDGLSLWQKPGSAGNCLRLERCIKPFLNISAYDSGAAPVRAIDCVGTTFAGGDFGGSDLNTYLGAGGLAGGVPNGTMPFGVTWLDGCTNTYAANLTAKYVNYGYAITGDDARAKSYFTSANATDELTLQDPLVFANCDTGDSCILITHNDGVLPPPLVASDFRTYQKGGWNNAAVTAAGGTVYWLIKTATGFKLATSYANAIAGTAIAIGDGVTGNGRTQLTRTLRTTATVVNTATDEVTVGADFYAMCSTGDATAFCQFLSAGNIAAPLLNDTTYYIIKTATANVIKLATSNANALAGTAINLTSTGANLMVLSLGPTEKLSQNDHLSYRPMSDNRSNTYDHIQLGRHIGHGIDINTGYANTAVNFEVADNDEGPLSSRNSCQLKHAYGEGTDMNGFANGRSIRCGTGFGCQEGSRGFLTNCLADGFRFYGIFANSTPYLLVTNPILRAGGIATDTNRPIYIYVNGSGSGFCKITGGTYDASPNGLSTWLFVNAAGGVSVSGSPTFIGNWTAGVVSSGASMSFSREFAFPNGYHYITPTTGRYGWQFSTTALTTTLGVYPIAAQGEFLQIIRLRLQSVDAIAATARIRAGPIGSTTLTPNIAPPTGVGTRKDYMAAASFTASAATDQLTLAADWVACVALNTTVRVTSPSGTLPAPLLENTDYRVIAVDATHIQLSLTAGGAAIDLTTAGSSSFIMIKGWAIDTGAKGLAASVNTVDAAGAPLLVEASWIPRT